MKVFFLLFVLFTTINFSFSQTADQLKTQLMFENVYGSKARSSASGAPIIGSEFLVEDWSPMEITLSTGVVEFQNGKLNLFSSNAEVIYNEREMTISPSHIKIISLSSEKRWFVPGTKYYYKDISVKGFLEVFSTSLQPPFIMEQHYVYVKEPSSNGYISGGSTELKLIKSSAIFLNDGIKLVAIKKKGDLEKFYVNDKVLFKKLSSQSKTNFKEAKSIHNLVIEMQKATMESK